MGIRVIPVLDVCAGQAVQAVGGDRANYRPIHSRLRPGSDPVQLAKAIRQAYGFNEFYLADLDAITTNVASDRLSGELMALGIQLWMDQGVRQAADILTLVNDRVAAIVVGLETLTHCADLRQIIKCAGADRVVFSLDLRAGRPIFATGSDWPVDEPADLAALAFEAGFRRILILDLARVGMGQGTGTLGLLARLVAKYPDVEWSVGGGIHSAHDVKAAESAGASAVLVGSALHDGRIEGIIVANGQSCSSHLLPSSGTIACQP